MSDETDDLMALDLECRLTIAHRLGCDCAAYLVRRRLVLIPEVMDAARRHNADPIDVFAGFARGVHARNCPTGAAA